MLSRADIVSSLLALDGSALLIEQDDVDPALVYALLNEGLAELRAITDDCLLALVAGPNLPRAPIH